MVARVTGATDKLAQDIGKRWKSEFEREFSNYNLLQKSKQILFDREVANIALLEKARQAEFEREFKNLQLLEKAKQAEFEREFQNLQLLEKVREAEFEREFKNLQLLEKAKDKEFEREFQNLQLLEKAKEAEFQRELENLQLLERSQEALQQEWLRRHRERVRRMRAVDRAQRDAVKREDADIQKKVKEEEKRIDAALKQHKDTEKVKNNIAKWFAQQNEAAKKKEHAEYLKRLRFNSQVMEDQRKAAEKKAREARNKAEREEQEAIRRREIAARKLADRMQKMAYRRPTSSRVDGGFGLGSRADIYMHANALQNIFQSGGGIIDMAAQLRDAEVMIETFTGSAQKAAVIMEDIKQFAAATPFSRLGLAKAAQSMMSYGVATNEVMPLLKQIGEISGGNQERFALLAYAISQIVSQTKLMGQELKQLTEHAFNPLATISEITGIEYEKLKKQMEAGTVSAQHVKDALRAATSEGGKHAGKLNKLSKELGGLINQVREGVMNMALDLFRVLEGDIKRGLNALLNILQKIQNYLNTDAGKKAMVFYANLAKNLFIGVAAFHSLGLVIALVRWQMANIVVIFHAVRMAMLPVILVVNVLGAVFGGLRTAVSVAMATVQAVVAITMAVVQGNMMAAGAAIAAVSGSLTAAAGAIVGGVLAFGGLLMGIAAVRDAAAGPGGLKGAFNSLVDSVKDMITKSRGFFWNFQENAKVLFSWVVDNYKPLLDYILALGHSMSRAFITNFGVIGKALVKTFLAAFSWLLINLPLMLVTLAHKANMAAIDIGKSILNGIHQGMANVASDLTGTGMGFLDGLLFGGMAGTVAKKADKAGAGSDIAKQAAEYIKKINSGGLTKELGDIWTQAFNDLQTGLITPAQAGVNLAMPQFNLTAPVFDTSPPPDLPVAPPFNPDFSALGQGALGKGAAKVDAAVRRGSSEHAVQAYQHMRNLSAVQASGKAGKQDLQKEQLQVSIEMRNAMRSIDKKINPQAGQQQMAALDPTAKGF